MQLDNTWFEDVEKANADTAPETIAKVTQYHSLTHTYIHTFELYTLGQVHKLIVQLKDTIQETTNKEMTQQVAI